MAADDLTARDTAPETPERPGPADGRGLRRSIAHWTLVVLLVAVPFALAHWAVRPGPDHAEGRGARATAGALENLGVRFGNQQVSQGLDLIAKDLTAIPGVEVERQRTSGTYRFHDRDIAYDVRNVIARQPGDSDDALLVNAHVDSALEGTGAADDAVNAGAVVEAARKLARTHHHYTVIYLFNGGEEAGATGSAGFIHHPWAKNVRWFLNLEAVGSGGLPILFQAGDNGGELVDLAGDVPRPYGSILGQWLFQAGLINSDTDSRVWRAQGWSGLDYALFGDGYTYHTPLDRTARIEPGSAQAITDLTTRLATHIADTPDLKAQERTPYYFNLASRWWVTIGTTTMKIWTLCVALALAPLVALACRRWRIRPGQVAASAAATLLGIVLALLAGVLGGVVAWAVGGSAAWYAHPWLVYLLPLPLAVLGALAPHLVIRRRRMRRDPARRDGARTALLAHACTAAVLAVVTAWLEFGPAYLVWTAGTLLTVAVGCALLLRRGWWMVPLAVAALVQCVLVAEFSRDLMSLAIPMMGRLPTAVPMDPVIGAVTAVVAVLLAVLLVPLMMGAGRARWFVWATCAATVCGLVVSALVSPYDTERPKLVNAFQEQTDGKTPRITLEGRDFLTPQALGMVDRVAKRTGLPVDDGALVTSDHVTVPSGPVDFSAKDSLAGPLTVKIGPNRANLVRITVTGPVTSVNGRSFHGGEATVDVLNRTGGFTADIARTGPVKVQVDQVFLTTGSEMKKVLAALPPWVIGDGRTVVQHTFKDPGPGHRP
ncbi:M28 family peptidase [Streptomyces sp. NPDC048106]|uniref:M28 family peptidase n=1 Tax=Streptomyces sp. NPDC048106 TaxID=3155750 RepID=UPI0034562D6A